MIPSAQAIPANGPNFGPMAGSHLYQGKFALSKESHHEVYSEPPIVVTEPPTEDARTPSRPLTSPAIEPPFHFTCPACRRTAI